MTVEFAHDNGRRRRVRGPANAIPRARGFGRTQKETKT
jgi:hypothetical protein